MTKVLIGILGVAIVVGAGLVAYLVVIWRRFLRRTRPSQPFAATAAPPAPDYAEIESWAARPDRPGKSLMVPKGETSAEPQSAPADAFFVHPTTYLTNRSWNAALEHPGSREGVDEVVIPWQATAFNACCRVYAPRYRQATLASFLGAGDSGRRALELAYSDVLRAFEHFLEHDNRGRPFVLAGHSQGTCHAIRLLEERIEGTPLVDRMVAAYLIGYGFPQRKFGHTLKTVRPCEGPRDTGCVIAWDSWSERSWQLVRRFSRGEHWYPTGDGGGTWQPRSSPIFCVNPLTWSSATAPVPREANRGAVYGLFSIAHPEPGVLFGDEPLGIETSGLSGPIRGAVSARCGPDGHLLVSEPEIAELRRAVIPGRNYHNYDYALFYMNLRLNVEERVATFLEQPGRRPSHAP